MYPRTSPPVRTYFQCPVTLGKPGGGGTSATNVPAGNKGPSGMASSRGRGRKWVGVTTFQWGRDGGGGAGFGGAGSPSALRSWTDPPKNDSSTRINAWT